MAARSGSASFSDAMGWMLVGLGLVVVWQFGKIKWEEQRFYSIVAQSKPLWVKEFKQLSGCSGGFVGGEARGSQGTLRFVVRLDEGRAYYRQDWFDSLCRHRS